MMELSELLNTDTVKLTVIPAILVLLVLFFWFKRSGKKRSRRNREYGRAPNSRHDNLDWATAVAEADQDVRLGQAYELDVFTEDDDISASDTSRKTKDRDRYEQTISDFDDDTLLNSPSMSANRDADIDFLDEVELIYKEPQSESHKTQQASDAPSASTQSTPRTVYEKASTPSSSVQSSKHLSEDIVYSYESDDELDQVETSTDASKLQADGSNQAPAHDSEAFHADKNQEETTPASKDPLLLVLNVLGTEGRHFRGAAILKAMAATGLTYGEMNIFHYYHPQRPGKAMFSIANMVEPGVFTLSTMDELTTPGLTLFASVGRPEEGINTFTIMLETAKKLAELLNGTVCDERRGTLSKQGIEHIHGQIREHQRRSRLVHAARA